MQKWVLHVKATKEEGGGGERGRLPAMKVVAVMRRSSRWLRRSWWKKWWSTSAMEEEAKACRGGREARGGCYWREVADWWSCWQIAVEETEKKKGWKTGVGAGFFVTLASDFPPFQTIKSAPIYRGWKNDILSLMRPNLGPWFDLEGSQLLV